MPSEEYKRFKAAVTRAESASPLAFGRAREQQRLTDWLQRLLDKGDPDAHADVEREWRRTLRLPGSLTDAEDWPDDLDQADGIDVPTDDPLYGWRYWYANNGQLIAPCLVSKTGVPARHPTTRWQPGINTSSSVHCRGRGPHPGPDQRCGCGIRAMASYRLAEAYAASLTDRATVVGRIAIWGRITGRAYATGHRYFDDPPLTIRASHARIVELYVDDEPELEAELRATYAVPETDEEAS